MKKIILIAIVMAMVFTAALAQAESVQLEPGQSHTFLTKSPNGDLTLMNSGFHAGAVTVSYKNSNGDTVTQNYQLAIYTMNSIWPANWPVTVSNNTSNAIFVVGF